MDEIISGCDITLSNVAIMNCSKVKIIVSNKINFNGTFELEVWSVFNVKKYFESLSKLCAPVKPLPNANCNF